MICSSSRSWKVENTDSLPYGLPLPAPTAPCPWKIKMCWSPLLCSSCFCYHDMMVSLTDHTIRVLISYSIVFDTTYDIIYKVTVRPTTPPWVRIVVPRPDWWKQCCCKGTMEIRTLQESTFIYIIWRTRLHDLRESLRVFLYTLQANCCQPSVCLLAAHAVLPPPCFQVLKNLTSCSPWLCCQISRTTISPSSTQNTCILPLQIWYLDCAKHPEWDLSIWLQAWQHAFQLLEIKENTLAFSKTTTFILVQELHQEGCYAPASAVRREMSRPVVLLTFSSSLIKWKADPRL